MTEPSSVLGDTAMEPPASFPSFAALRAAHSALLQRRRIDGASDAFLAEVERFIMRGCATGALLDADADRWSCQSMLDYWSNILYRAGHPPPDGTLAEFDPTLAPDLDDALCPYQGLRAFWEQQNDLFFGRQRLVERLVDQLQQQLLVIVGSSGSGKSSVVRAGLIPALRAGALPGSQSWRYLPPIVPGAQPLAQLVGLFAPPEDARAWIEQQAAQCRQRADHLAQLLELDGALPAVLTIDQFEEVFTLCDDDQARHAFVANLVTLIEQPAPGHRVIITLRSDFESRIARLPALQPFFEQSQVRMTPLNASELRDAIEKPAEAVGLKFEEGVVDALIQEMLGEPAALPLLQFTLRKLWEQRDHNRVTWETYRRLGGGRMALAHSADVFYNGLIPEDQIAVRRILLRMVRPSEGLEVTSKRTQRSALYRSGEAADRLDRVLDKLVQARLVTLTPGETLAEDRVEVAHEALVRNWPRLVGWLEKERVALRQRLHLSATAEQWTAAGRDPGMLLRGTLLDEALRYEDLNTIEAAFVEESKAAVHAAEQAAEAARRRELEQTQALLQAERQRARILGLTMLALFAALLVMLALRAEAVANERRATANAQQAAVARATAEGNAQAAATARAEAVANAQQAATAQANLAELNGALATSRQLAAQSLAVLKSQPDLALLLGIAANETSDTIEAHGSLITGLEQSLPLASYLRGHLDAVQSVALSPDNRTLASSSADSSVLLWDVESGKPRGAPLAGLLQAINSVAFSPDGRLLAAGGCGNLNQQRTCEAGALRLWDLATLRSDDYAGHAGAIQQIAFSRDGRLLASVGQDGTLIVWDVAIRQETKPPGGPNGGVRSIAFNADETMLALGGSDGAVRLWNLTTGESIELSAATAEEVNSVAFSPDGQLLATAGCGTRVPDFQACQQGEIRLWDVPTRQQIGEPLTGHDAEVRSITFNADGSQLISGGGDQRLLRWDVATRQQIDEPLIGHRGAVNSVALSSDGATLVSGGADSNVIVWRLAQQRRLGQPLGDQSEAVWSLAYSPIDRSLLAVGTSAGQVQLWKGAAPLATLKEHTGVVLTLAFSPDGKRLASGSDDGTVLLWDVATQRRLLKLDDHSGAINSVALSPDGRLLAAGGADGSIRLWDAGTGQPIDLLEGRQDQVWSVAFSPDGKWLASGGGDRKVILWDVVSRTLARTLTGHASSVNSVAFSPDGQLLASADGASTILLWDLTTLQRIGDPLIGHSSSIWSVAFSPDSRLLVSAGFDKSLVLWDVATRQQIGEPLTGYTQAITEVAFNQDGTLLASGSAGDGVTVWTIDPAAQRALACSIVNRNLSSTEWTQYMPARPYRPPCTETQPELYALGQTMARIQALQLSGDTASIETLYRRVMAWLPSADSLYLNNYVCWYGSLDGFGAIVAPACDHAVAIAPSALQPFYRDARGLARARSGDYRGAIEDFRAFVAWLPGKGLDEEKYRMSREKLIAALDAGRDPFDKDTLQKLRSE